MRILPILLLLAAAHGATADELSDKQAELQALQQKIQHIGRALAQDEARHDAVTRELQDTEQRLAGLRQALRVLSRDLAAASGRAERLQAEQQTLQARLREQYRALEAQLRSAFVIGRQARSRMLLSQDDPARLARLQVYLEHFQQQHQREIAGFEQTLDALNRKRREATQALAELRQTQLSRRQTLAGIEQQRQARNAVLQRIEARLKAQGRSLGALQAEQARLEKLIEQLSQAVLKHSYVAPSGPFAENRGRLIPPADGRLLARYNQRKPGGETRWQGLWIAAEAGTPVRAVAAARVVYVGWMHRLGLLLVLDHGGGYFSLYGHNRSALKQVGDEVAAGDAIAEAGDTGGHRQSGVYLEIRKGRTALDPGPWLAAKSP